MKEKEAIKTLTNSMLDTQQSMVLYGSMMTIMLVLFIILFLLARNKTEQSQQKLKLVENASRGKEHLEKAKQELEAISKIEQEGSLVDAKAFDISTDGEYINIRLGESILFKKGEYEIDEEKLSKVMKTVLEKFKTRNIIVEGHTDNVPIVGGKIYKSNWELSTMRAMSVVRFMVKNGISGENIRAFGYGEYKPISENSAESGKAKNRRIEIKVQRT